MKQKIRCYGLTGVLIILSTVLSFATPLKGLVIDKTNNEPLIGATIQIVGTPTGVITNVDGIFEFPNLKAGKYSLEIKSVGYQTQIIKDINIVNKKEASVIKVEMNPESQALGEVMVVAEAKKSSEAALITATRNSLVMQNGVSAQQIKRTQDRDASEVIRRIPGISIIDDKFVMVRGLSQRYNNVWINGGAVPSSEADSRAFSFDIIPSSQLDNMMIVKSPAPEYPADFSGGFILINTKDVPAHNAFSISVGGNYNDNTHGNDFFTNKESGTDFLGFDNGLRKIKGGFNAALNPIANGIDLQNNGFNNDWTVKNRKPLADMNLASSLNHYWKFGEKQLALMAAVNYSNGYKSFTDMENSLFGAYDITNDRSNYLRKSTDNQYNHNVRVGAMVNLTFIPGNGNNKYELKNIFNQLGKSRYTYRSGVNAQKDNEESAEYYYSSRTTYNTQLTGLHRFDSGKLDWSVGYALANRCLPDRRKYIIDDSLEPNRIGLSSSNDINREYTNLNENIFSGNINWEHHFDIGAITPTIKVGTFNEYRTRKYRARNFYYNWNASNNTLPSGFRYFDIPTELLVDANYGADKLYLLEEVKWRNNYDGNNLLNTGYVGINLPINKLSIYTGVRFEHNRMELISNTRNAEKSPSSTYYNSNDFFPSINSTYKLNEKNQFRLSYGKSVNRPEFREVSSSVFYDFELASNVQGNTELKSCYVDNLDLRYELYPSNGEQISFALFYKNFKNPIEWVYTVTGGTDLSYSFKNAKKADNYGAEIEIRKNLDFIGLPMFNINFNGALIKSNVRFDKGSKEKSRSMQGQSPYLINAGLFYHNEASTINLGVLYNRIGKRIIGVGRSVGTTGGDETTNIPNSYEMPRNAIDITSTFKLNKKCELKMGIHDLLAEKVSFKQFADVTKSNGTNGKVEEITKQYKPGRNFNLSVNYSF